jgi:hypothetical protein
MADDDFTTQHSETDENYRRERREKALNALQRLNDAQLAIVPQCPTQYMCAIGAQAGGVDLFTARRIYRAMLAASQERPTIN